LRWRRCDRDHNRAEEENAVVSFRHPVAAIIGAVLAWASPSIAQTPAAAKDGTQIQLSDVPKAALAAARKEPEAKPTAAKTTTFEGQPAFESEGTNKYDKHLSTVIAPDGKVLVGVNIWEADED
jgi:hypothetical protein